MTVTTIAIIAITLALFFNFSNGFHDAANIVATVISSRSMSVRRALMMTAILVFIGSFFLGTAVAETIGNAIIRSEIISIRTVLAATMAAIIWNLITWYYGIPSSSSHALIGGLVGAALFQTGPDAVHWFKLLIIIAVIIASPLIGFAASFIITRINFKIFRDMRPRRARWFLSRLQIAASALLALAHGTNDAQKAMGIITLSLILLHPLDPAAIAPFYTPAADGAFQVPGWAILSCSLAISLGMFSGGGRIIRTIGLKLYKIRTSHGFGAQLSSALVVYTCSALGFPVSTTQISSSSIMGAGAAQRFNIVRWGIAGEIMAAWLITLPATLIIAALISGLFNFVI